MAPGRLTPWLVRFVVLSRGAPTIILRTVWHWANSTQQQLQVSDSKSTWTLQVYHTLWWFDLPSTKQNQWQHHTWTMQRNSISEKSQSQTAINSEKNAVQLSMYSSILEITRIQQWRSVQHCYSADNMNLSLSRICLWGHVHSSKVDLQFHVLIPVIN